MCLSVVPVLKLGIVLVMGNFSIVLVLKPQGQGHPYGFPHTLSVIMEIVSIRGSVKLWAWHINEPAPELQQDEFSL